MICMKSESNSLKELKAYMTILKQLLVNITKQPT